MICDIIDCVIVCGVGFNDVDNMVEFFYEGYVLSGVVIIVEVMIDNCNCIVVEVCYVFSKCGGNLGIDGLVVYMFECKGQISFVFGVDEEVLMDVVLEVGVDDVVVNDDGFIDVFIIFVDFILVNEVLVVVGFKGDEVEVIMIFLIIVILDLEIVQKVFKLIDMFEDLDDVQNVYFNVDILDDVMVQFG